MQLLNIGTKLGLRSFQQILLLLNLHPQLHITLRLQTRNQRLLLIVTQIDLSHRTHRLKILRRELGKIVVFTSTVVILEGLGGIHCAKSKNTLIVGVYGESTQPGSAAVAVENFAAHLGKNNM